MLGTTTSRRRLVDLLVDDQARAEAHPFDVEVFVDGLEFLAQRDEVLLAAEQPTKQRRELDDQHARGFGLRADERRDRRQRVEQEVRIDLIGQRIDARHHQQVFLLGQPMLDARAVPDLDGDGDGEHRGQRHQDVVEPDVGRNAARTAAPDTCGAMFRRRNSSRTGAVTMTTCQSSVTCRTWRQSDWMSRVKKNGVNFQISCFRDRSRAGRRRQSRSRRRRAARPIRR